MDNHNKLPQVAGFMESVAPFLEGPIGVALYEYRNGQISNVCVHGGPKGEGGLDDATGAGGAGGAGMKQTSTVVDLTQINDEEDDAQLDKSFKKELEKSVGVLKNLFGKVFAGSSK
eukprot:jgi/Chrzof1/7624/Cz02g30190.t1